MPFVDPEMLPFALTFIYKGEILAEETVVFDNGAASDLFALYGIEFASQYIAADPANAGIDLALQDFELPPKVRLTCNSLEPLVKYCGFKFGDRLLCRVTDWDLGIVEVVPVKRNDNAMQMHLDDVERQNWYGKLEKNLLASFDMTGPCSSIEEQLAVVFFDNSKTLCTAECGSIEEFLAQSRKVAYEPFGVETRLWRYGEDVPAIGKWNALIENNELSDAEAHFLNDLAVADYILDAYIEDQFFNKRYKPEEIIAAILPKDIQLTEDERHFFLLHVNARHDIIGKKYNWFADFLIGPLRHRALALYRETSSLIFEIDRSATDLERYPQQGLVILSQIFTHVMHILEMLEFEPANAAKDIDEIEVSLEGMECNFEGVSNELIDMVESEKRRKFIVIK